MTDLAKLQSQILADIAAAGDEAALESVRVAALGLKRRFIPGRGNVGEDLGLEFGKVGHGAPFWPGC